MSTESKILKLIRPHLMPLLAMRAGEHKRVDGTAFLIGPGWAMTATHVVLEYIRALDAMDIDAMPRDKVHRNIKPKFNLCVGLIDGASRITTIHVVESYFAFPGDVCVLRLRDDQFDWKKISTYPRLKLTPPEVGRCITAVGLPKSSTSQSKKRLVVTLHLKHAFSSGTVLEVHDLQRDGFNLDFPCYRTNANILGGMSGGPVIDEDGCICGIVSTSYDLVPDGEPISYMATLWQCVYIQVRNGVAGLAEPFFNTLKSEGFCIDDIQKISLEQSASGSFNIKISPT